jgi:hypothetical protein
MPRRLRPSILPTPEPDTPPAPDRPPAAVGGLSRNQVCQWAELIADGRGEFPAELPPPERDRIAAEVRRRLRDRLLRFIARQIARDLGRDSGPPS